MSTLIEQLPAEIARVEAKFGSDNPFVKQLKEQLRGMKENGNKSAKDVYRLQAVNFGQPSAPAKPKSEVEKLREKRLK